MFEKLKKFIEDNKILTRKELQNNYPYKYKLFCKLSNEEKDKLISVQDPSKYSSLRTVEDFQKYIDENNIESNEDFYTNYASVYGKCRKVLSKEERLSLKFKIMINHNDWSSFKTLSDFQNFIDCHKIKSNKEFVKNFPGLYNKYIHTLSKEKRLLKFSPRKEPFSELVDFQKYIDENKIQTYREFQKDHKTIYMKYLDKRSNWDNDELIFPIKPKENKYAHLKTNSDFQKYIDENNINSRKDFKNNRFLESRYYKVVPKEERCLVFKEEIKHIFRNEFSTIEEFQKFIDENNIFRPIDFRNNYPKVYDRFCRTISTEDKYKLIYGVDRDTETKRRSYGERYIMRLLSDNNINFISEKIFPDLKGESSYLRYDFYLPDYNILIEYHGEQHFNKNTLYYSETLLENDKKKYEYAIKSGIKILYFTLHKSVFEKFGYFTNVITDDKTLIKEIKTV